MNREYHRWYSPILGRDMELLLFGHAGARVLVFPSSMGRCWEWEDFGMVRALADFIARGWIQLVCVDSVDAESWYAKHVPPDARARRHTRYDRYVLEEVLPFSAWRNPNPLLVTTGASFGAYHAMAFALRHPDRVGRVLGLSGVYDVRPWAGGGTSDDVYYANPFEFIQHEQDHARLEAMRRMDIIISVGRDDPNYENNVAMSQRLWDKGIWHAFRTWDGWAHDWPYWKQMVRLYIGGHD
jgi:esterase/lipase superfamily enzyme